MRSTAIQGYLRAATRGTQVGPFLTTLDTHSDNPYRNYACPQGDIAPTPAELGALLALFAERDRMPRFEYVSPADGLETALTAAGFAVDQRLPMMSIDAADLVEPEAPDGVEVRLCRTPEDFRLAAAVQNAAYGEGEPTDADIARVSGTVTRGGAVALAVDTATGAGVGSGLFPPPRDGVTEVAAVGVLPGYRRRGIASAVGYLLTRAALEAGATPFLQTEHEAERTLYGRIGYTVAGEMTFASLRPLATIRGQRVVLRPVHAPTAARVAAGDPDVLAERFGLTAGDGWPHADTADGMRIVAAGAGSARSWLVTLDGTAIGDCGTFGPPDGTGSVEIGYGLAAPYRGHGHGGDLVRALSGWLLGEHGVRRVVARTAAGNTASRRALERAGFAESGAGDSAVDGQVDGQVDGDGGRLILYALTAHE